VSQALLISISTSEFSGAAYLLEISVRYCALPSASSMIEHLHVKSVCYSNAHCQCVPDFCYHCIMVSDRLCGLVTWVPGYRPRGPGFDSLRYQIIWEAVGLEHGPLSLLSINEKLFEWIVMASVYITEINGSGDSSRRLRDTPLSAKVGTKIRR
jgi:hypothetical protein